MPIYIMCVGRKDPYWRKEKERIVYFDEIEHQGDLSEGPILTFFSKLQPTEGDRVYLLSTAKGEKVVGATMNGGSETAKVLESYGLGKENIRHWPLSGVDPTNLGELVPAMKEKVLDIIDENGRDAEYIINTSPGTPQMQAVWYMLVNSGVIRADLYKVNEKTSSIERIDIIPLFEEELKNIAIQFAKNFSFGEASVVLHELSMKTANPERKAYCEIFRDIFEVYSDWMVFKYEEALEKIRKILNNPILNNISNSFKILIRQREKLEELAQARDLLVLRAIDFYSNAGLKLRNDYVNAIWLYKECCEKIIVEYTKEVLERMTKQKIDIKNLNVEGNIPRYLRELFNKHRELNGSSACQFLERVEKNQKVAFDSSLRRKFEELSKKRNRVLHEGEKATYSHAERARTTAEKIMEKFGVLDDACSYPFSSHHFSEVCEDARTII